MAPVAETTGGSVQRLADGAGQNRRGGEGGWA